jgi:O-antigen biosynthesis protein
MIAPGPTAESSAARPFASLIILNFNGRDHYRNCLDSVLASDFHDYEIVLVDQASTDGSREEIIETYGDRIRPVCNEQNLLSSGGLNSGIAQARGEIIVLLDLDTIVRPDWLRELLAPLQDPTVAVTGSKLLFPDGTVQHAGGRVLWTGFTMHEGHRQPDGERWNTQREFDYVTGAAIAIRRSAFDLIGCRLDEFFPFYYEEVDVCWHLRRLGYKVLYVPTSVAIHCESASMGQNSDWYLYNFHRSRLRYMMKNFSLVKLLGLMPFAEIKWLLCASRNDVRWKPLTRAYAAAVLALPGAVQRRIERRRRDRQLARNA